MKCVFFISLAWGTLLCGCVGGSTARREDLIRKRQYELNRRAARLRAAERRFSECVAEKYPGKDPGLEPIEEDDQPTAAITSGTSGVLSPEELEEVQRVERIGRAGIISCYTDELELRGDKKLRGRVVVRILIGPSGSATRVEIGQSTLRAPRVHQCIVNTIRKWEFPNLKKASWYSTTFDFSPAY